MSLWSAPKPSDKENPVCFSHGCWCRIKTGRFELGWKVGGKFQSVGIRPAMFCSVSLSFGSIRRFGPGLDGKVSQMETRQNLMSFLFLAALLLAGGCGENKSESVAAAPPTAPLVPSSTPVERLRPTPSKADETLTVSGPLIVEHQVEVTAQRDGVVAKILFDAPTRVRERTVLARLDDRQISANLEA